MSTSPDIGRLLAKASTLELRPRVPFLGLAVAAVLGIYTADRWELSSSWLLVAAGTTAVAAWLSRRFWVVLAFAFLVFAALHGIRHIDHPGRSLESAMQGDARAAQVSGVVSDEPQRLSFARGAPMASFPLKVDRLAIGERSVEYSGSLIITWAGPFPQYGDRVEIAGALKPLAVPRNPGQFNFGKHLTRKSIFGRLEAKYPEDCRVIEHDRGNLIVATAFKSRHWMQEQLGRGLEDSPELASLISSMVLGMRGETPEDIQDLFKQTGTLHLFAVSGLNIAMLAIIAGFVLRPLGLNHRAAAMVIIPLLAFYALITGLSASCVRAAIMGALVLFGSVAERNGSVYNSLCAAATLILAWDTNQLFTPGFQFSFVLVLTIVVLANRIQGKVQPWGMPDPFLPRPLWSWRQHGRALVSKWLAASFGVTIASWLGSLAFTAGYFHLFSPSAVVANMVAVPIAFLVLALGLATLLVAPLSGAAAGLFANANWICAKGLLLSVEYFASLPGSHVYVELPRPERQPALEITALDVGDGAAIHLRSSGHDWLIDGGPAWRYRTVTAPYLRSRGINRLDALVLTHGDAQHIGSLASVLEGFQTRVVYDSPLKDRSSTRRKLHQQLSAAHRGKSFVAGGDLLELGGAKVSVLFPPIGLLRSAVDDKALALMVECQHRRVLLMSDSGFNTEQWLIGSGTDLRADVLIKGQHGKDLSGTGEFLDRVRPLAIVISAEDLRRSPRTFHDWADGLKGRDISLFAQDQCGAVTVTIRDGILRVSGFVNDQTLLSRAR